MTMPGTKDNRGILLGLMTQCSGGGGIERLSGHHAAVLSRFAKERDLALHLLVLNDIPNAARQITKGDNAIVSGFSGNKLRFVSAAIAQARRTRLAYIAHPSIAVLGYVIRIIQPKARYLVHAHGTDVWYRRSPITRASLRAAEILTASSRDTASKLVSLQGVESSKTTVVWPAVDDRFLEAARSRNHEPKPVEGPKLLLTVARLSTEDRYKGVDNVIRVLPAVIGDAGDTRYVVVGDGDERPSLERLAREVGVADKVIFVGRVSESELVRHYQECDLFVMPSAGEGFGIAFLEAMAFGKPVIGGNNGGTPDVVRDGLNGFAVRHSDKSALRARISSLLNDDGLRSSMGRAGRELLADFTYAALERNLMNVLARVSNGAERGRGSPALQADRTITESDATE